MHRPRPHRSSCVPATQRAPRRSGPRRRHRGAAAPHGRDPRHPRCGGDGGHGPAGLAARHADPAGTLGDTRPARGARRRPRQPAGHRPAHGLQRSHPAPTTRPVGVLGGASGDHRRHHRRARAGRAGAGVHPLQQPRPGKLERRHHRRCGIPARSVRRWHRRRSDRDADRLSGNQLRGREQHDRRRDRPVEHVPAGQCHAFGRRLRHAERDHLRGRERRRPVR